MTELLLVTIGIDVSYKTIRGDSKQIILNYKTSKKMSKITIYCHYALDPSGIVKYYYDLKNSNGSDWSPGIEAFCAYETQEPGTVALYMHESLQGSSDRYRYDTNQNDGSSYWGPGTLLCYVYNTKQSDTIPIYQHIGGDGNSFFYDTQESNINNPDYGTGQFGFYALPPDISMDAITKAVSNLNNMIDWNNKMASTGKDKIQNAYYLLTSSKVDTEPWYVGTIINVLEGFFSAAATEVEGPLAAFMAGFFSGVVSGWSSNTPPNLGGATSGLFNSITKGQQVIYDELSRLYNSLNPPSTPVIPQYSYWLGTYNYNGKMFQLGDLATNDFPNKDQWGPNGPYLSMLDAATLEIDKRIWISYIQMTCSYYVNNFGNSTSYEYAKEKVRNWYTPGEYPGIYARYQNETPWGYSIANCYLGPGGNQLSLAACQYLIIDGLPGEILNPGALFTRIYLFNNIMPIESQPNWAGYVDF